MEPCRPSYALATRSFGILDCKSTFSCTENTVLNYEYRIPRTIWPTRYQLMKMTMLRVLRL
jgi:hypothetical protein